jgi:hypothetical protein
MKTIKPTKNKHHWPRNAVKSVECRKQDLVLRITDWMKDKDEPGYDVECYIGGVYDWNESESFTIWKYKTEAAAKQAAIAYAQAQVSKLL